MGARRVDPMARVSNEFFGKEVLRENSSRTQLVQEWLRGRSWNIKEEKYGETGC